MVAKLATLTESHIAQTTSEGFLARVGIFVLLFILLQTEGFWAKTAFEVLLRIVFLIVPLERELSFEGRVALVNVALKDC